VTMWSELHEQAEVVARLVERLVEPASPAVALVADHQGPVLGVGRGTSDNALRYAQYVWGQRRRLAVGLAVPALHSRYASPPDLTGALVVGMSQSGRSPDLLAVLEDARAQGCSVLAITNDADSPMARIADAVVDLDAGPERAVAATKSYTAQLAAVAGLAAGDEGRDALLGVADAISRTLAEADRFASAGQVPTSSRSRSRPPTCAMGRSPPPTSSCWRWSSRRRARCSMTCGPLRMSCSAAALTWSPSPTTPTSRPTRSFRSMGRRSGWPRWSSPRRSKRSRTVQPWRAASIRTTLVGSPRSR